MSDVYIFAGNSGDFTTAGMVGAVSCLRCETEELANGLFSLELEAPVDTMGMFKAIREGNIVRALTPVRVTPAIDMRDVLRPLCVTAMEKWVVSTATAANPCVLYNKEVGGSKVCYMYLNEEVSLLIESKHSARYYVKYTRPGKTTSKQGWVDTSRLTYVAPTYLAPNPGGIEGVQPSARLDYQLFRIYEVNITGDTVRASARHITYDLLNNLTSYSANAATCAQAAVGVLKNCANAHDFSIYTDIGAMMTGIDYEDIDPIRALLDPDEGIAARWGAQVVRNDFEIYVLKKAGIDRGVSIEYGKNITGIEAEIDLDNVVTRLKPYGAGPSGGKLYLTDYGAGQYLDSPLIGQYPTVHARALDLSRDYVAKTQAEVSGVRADMRTAALEQYSAYDVDKPRISLRVKFIDLGETVEYAHYRDLEKLFLFDTVRVRYQPLDIDVKAQVVRLKFDCLLERVSEMEVGLPRQVLLMPKVTAFQLPRGIPGSYIGAGTISNSQISEDYVATMLQNAGMSLDAGQFAVYMSYINLIIRAAGDDAEFALSLTEDGQLVLKNLIADSIESDSIVNAYIGPNVIYAQANGLNEALAALNNRYLADNVYVFVPAGGALYEEATLRGVSGPGVVIIAPSDMYTTCSLFGKVTIDRCASVAVIGLSICGATQPNCAEVWGSQAFFGGCEFIGSTSSSALIRTDASNVEAQNSMFYLPTRVIGYGFALSAVSGSSVTLKDNYGALNNNAHVYCASSTVYVDGSVPSRTRANESAAGGQIYEKITAVDPGPPTPPPTQTATTRSYLAVNSGTYQGSWLSDYDIRQGYSTGGRANGAMWFDNTTLRGHLSGKTVRSATIRFYRLNGFGQAAYAKMQLYGITNSGRSGACARVTYYGEVGRLQCGSGGTFTLPNAAVTDLRNGTINGYCLYSDDTTLLSGKGYSANYMKAVGADGPEDKRAMITVTYT